MRVCVYYTVSKKLRDDFEEILLKAGWTYHTSVRPLKNRYIGKRIIKKENLVPCFEIRLRRNNKAQIKSLHKKKRFYKGKVFCLQLSKYHNFYVRRSGTGYFTGNSLAGLVVAAAVIVKESRIKNKELRELNGVKDSKQLTPKQRESLYKLLTSHPQIRWGIGRVSEKVIDKINILEATKLAMQKALKNLGCRVYYLILDGSFKIKSKIPQKSIIATASHNCSLGHKRKIDFSFLPSISIIKADEKVFSCAAASIIAKVTRDKIMLRYDKKYPKYNFKKHKGYPTKLHRKILKKIGPCPIHRKSFSWT
ncbi:ribonuclease HII [Patescibacteria group bacterium]|nr:ribonuclease HII [Patescibacteria group bacterium]MBU4367753.1 ribonuclease HII [Patescibacteria group bacterium]MBU4461797.1 ribonuclease HII [Patescibacteria group bacterium]